MKHAFKIVMVSLMTMMGAACTGSRDATSSSTEVAATPATPAAIQQSMVATAHADSAILDACSLVSQADAESILGTPAKQGEHAEDDKHASHCQYEAANQDTSGFNNLIVEINADEDANEAKTGFAIHRKIYENSNSGAVYTYEVLTGIGDDAFLVTNKVPESLLAMPAMIQDQQMLFVVKGAKDILVNTNYGGTPRSADSLKALAKKLADHI